MGLRLELGLELVGLELNASLELELRLGLGSHKSQNTNLQGFIPKHYNNVQEVQYETQLTVTEGHQTSDNIVKLSDKRVYNASDIKDLLAHHDKGRSFTKCLKAFNEEINKAGISKKQQINIDYEKNEKTM
ncbi:hypothetical protein RhiirA4_451767 [Rhizophagus irregularis]|uniref:Uncharacterized protein n=1 Tax=Rhizophagus irregularis TaxID=588596 RepID=A0A2I1FWK0_9GLOM|nr:hypothetical protein RhiirA4_451767 [Rhizophagus irregularis]